MDVNVSEEEAIELLSKYYPELLNPVVEAKKDFERANTVQNAKDEGFFYQETGRKLLEKKNYDQAIVYFQKAIVKEKKAQNGSEKHSGISKSYQYLGEAYEGKEEVEEALQSYQRGLISNASDFNDADLLSNPETTDLLSNFLSIPILEAKGNLLLKTGNKEHKLLAALMAYERAIEILDLLCKKYVSEYTKLALSEQITILSEKAIQASLKLYKVTRNKLYKKKVFTIVEKGKAMVLTSSLLASKAQELSNAPTTMLKREQRLKTRIAQLNQNIKGRGRQKDSPEKLEKKLFALTQQLFFLQDSLKVFYPKTEYLKFVPPTVAMDSLQHFLSGRNTAIVSYFFGIKNAFAFTLTANNFHIEKIEEVEQLRYSVLALRKDIQSQHFKTNATQSFETFTTNASLIYGLALEESLAHVDQEIQELIIIPDDALWLVPFDLLLYDKVKNKKDINFGPQQLPYLLNKFAISYAHSSKFLYKDLFRSKKETDLPFLGFAPEFSGEVVASKSCFSSNLSLSKLAFNQVELEEIAQHFEGQPFYGFEANKKQFIQTAPRADIIHLSTHACLNKEDPMQSRIFFANEDYLTTEEIYDLDIQAKMVVLSACQTGLGQIYKGEGMISLARAFAQAGCPSITMSLWSVVDETTSQIMINYYENLDDGINKSRALQKAKLSYLEEQPKAKQHPYYWAAFIPLGDVSPIEESTFGGMTFWLLGGGVLVLMGLFMAKRG